MKNIIFLFVVIVLFTNVSKAQGVSLNKKNPTKDEKALATRLARMFKDSSYSSNIYYVNDYDRSEIKKQLGREPIIYGLVIFLNGKKINERNTESFFSEIFNSNTILSKLKELQDNYLKFDGTILEPIGLVQADETSKDGLYNNYKANASRESVIRVLMEKNDLSRSLNESRVIKIWGEKVDRMALIALVNAKKNDPGLKTSEFVKELQIILEMKFGKPSVPPNFNRPLVYVEKKNEVEKKVEVEKKEEKVEPSTITFTERPFSITVSNQAVLGVNNAYGKVVRADLVGQNVEYYYSIAQSRANMFTILSYDHLLSWESTKSGKKFDLILSGFGGYASLEKGAAVLGAGICIEYTPKDFLVLRASVTGGSTFGEVSEAQGIALAGISLMPSQTFGFDFAGRQSFTTLNKPYSFRNEVDVLGQRTMVSATVNSIQSALTSLRAGLRLKISDNLLILGGVDVGIAANTTFKINEKSTTVNLGPKTPTSMYFNLSVML